MDHDLDITVDDNGTDAHLIHPKDDKLKRAHLAKRLAESIVKLDTSSSSYVIGIQGKWGEGKSSFINFIISYLPHNELFPQYKDASFFINPALPRPTIRDHENLVDIYHFAPWRFSSADDLVKKFFDNLPRKDSSIFTDDNWKQIQSFVNTVSKISNQTNKITAKLRQIYIALYGAGFITIPLEYFKNNITIYFSPIILFSLAFFFTIPDLYNLFFDSKNKKKDSLENDKLKIKNITKKWKGKLVVIIDDIDRLEPREIRQTIRLVKSQCDLPNIVYILGYDKNEIANAYSDIKKESSPAFLEKIVQHEVHLTPLTEPQAAETLISMTKKHLNLDKVETEELQLALSPEAPVAKAGYDHSTGKIIPHYFKTVRDLKRFFNSLKFAAAPFKTKKVFQRDVTDFLLIEILRFYNQDAYKYLSSRKTQLTTFKHDKTNKEIETLSFFDEHAKEIAKYLFLNHINKASIKRGIRIIHPEYFDSYFLLYIPEQRIKYEHILKLFSTATDNQEDTVLQIKEYVQKEYISVADQINREYYNLQEINYENAAPMLKALILAQDNIRRNSPETSLTIDTIRAYEKDDAHAANLLLFFVQNSNNLSASELLFMNTKQNVSKEKYDESLKECLNIFESKLKNGDKEVFDQDAPFLFPILVERIPEELKSFLKNNLVQFPCAILPFFGNASSKSANASWIRQHISGETLEKWFTAAKATLENTTCPKQSLKSAINLMKDDSYAYGQPLSDYTKGVPPTSVKSAK